ncbi:DUF624 domain-containing protein [Paenalkalicoccus suaedae]|uniref:DUF624 domain-containing protein n=1 Tax=Paenalkalicoccus suaedae TaxID=2592382 RepID=A0A859FJ53_9BACI|nr:DUF624 domain-containing protein [Paenalkalicoccus suaedae]QKS72506.1 DUF624 domain-containing protein [Paenalkalicoccus suaedae]
MKQNGFTAFFYTFSDWFAKIVYLNILWIFFTFAGFIIFSISPATIALFAVIRQLLIEKDSFSITKKFWHVFKGEFFKANGIGICLTIVATSLALYLQLFMTTENTLLQALYYPMLMVAILLGLTILYFIPSYIHYNHKLVPTFKNACLVMIVSPLNTFTMASSVFVIAFVSLLFPILIVFFSVSLFALFVMMTALRTFRQVELKKGVAPSHTTKTLHSEA